MLRLLGGLLIILWIPFIVPLFILGIVARLMSAALIFGYDFADDGMQVIGRSFIKERR